MKALRPVYQAVIIVNSVLILALVAAALTPKFQGLLPLAALLAGVNAMLHSRTLEGLRPVLKRCLLVGGLLTVLLMGVVVVVRFLR